MNIAAEAGLNGQEGSGLRWYIKEKTNIKIIIAQKHLGVINLQPNPYKPRDDSDRDGGTDNTYPDRWRQWINNGQIMTTVTQGIRDHLKMMAGTLGKGQGDISRLQDWTNACPVLIIIIMIRV
jgi:hypothetical protein